MTVPSETSVTADRYERLYTMLLEGIPSSVLLIDAHLRVISANANFLRKARVAADAVLGRKIDDVFPPAIVQSMNLRQRVARVFTTAEPVRGERLTYRAPGVPASVYYYSLLPFSWGGRVEHVLLLMEDITEQVRLGEEVRRAERHLASVVESASDVVVSMDVSGRVLTWNTAAEKITGHDSADVRGRPLTDLCRHDQRAALADLLAQVPKLGRTNPVEVDLLGSTGEAVPVAWVCSPMRDAGGQVIGLVAVGRDLTERRRLEAQLIQSEKLAALGVMAGGIAHEIRNPLAVVASAAQLLLEKKLPAEVQAECAERIHRGVQRASGVIESLLRFARPSDRGAMEPLELGAVVKEAANLVANQLKLARADLFVTFTPEPLAMVGNISLLQQLVANLLLNAANAMPERGGEVWLSLDRAEGMAVLRVTDTGKGIAAADQSRVFDPFFTTMPVGKGTGLGLSICYAIVRHHNGQIELASAEGQGTTVTITLPLEDST